MFLILLVLDRGEVKKITKNQKKKKKEQDSCMDLIQIEIGLSC